jgi:hypothetical protein
MVVEVMVVVMVVVAATTTWRLETTLAAWKQVREESRT